MHGCAFDSCNKNLVLEFYVVIIIYELGITHTYLILVMALQIIFLDLVLDLPERNLIFQLTLDFQQCLLLSWTSPVQRLEGMAYQFSARIPDTQTGFPFRFIVDSFNEVVKCTHAEFSQHTASDIASVLIVLYVLK